MLLRFVASSLGQQDFTMFLADPTILFLFARQAIQRWLKDREVHVLVKLQAGTVYAMRI